MKLKFGSWSLIPYLTVVLFLGLQACGGGSSTPEEVNEEVNEEVTTDANPVGYYAGTFNYSTPTDQGTTATDIAVKAIVDSDKFLMVHIDHATPDTILYKGTFTDITATTFTANVKIYRNGAALTTSAIDAIITNGGITEKSSMSGTLSGTGNYTDTSFSLSYDTTINARTPLVPVLGEIWLEPLTTSTSVENTGIGYNGADTSDFTFGFGDSSIVHDTLKGCNKLISTSDVVSEQVGRIRKYSAVDILASECTNTTENFDMEGYVTTFDLSGTDNLYLWITYNDNNFFAGELVKQ